MSRREEQTPTVAVVICTRDRPRELERCLKAVTRLEPAPDEVLIVDNAPSSAPAKAIAEAFGVRYVAEPIAGLSRARNTGAANCRADVVAYTDDDAVPERDWIAHLARPFRDQRVIAVNGRIDPLSVDTEGRISSNDPDKVNNRSSALRSIGRENPKWFEMANFGGLGDGGNQAIRRRAFQVWNGFDVRLGRGSRIGSNEDHFSLFELLELDHRVVYEPRAVVRHPFPRAAAEIRRRRQTAIEEFVAYSAFLATARPRYAFRVLRYGIQAIFGARRDWRFDGPPIPAVGSGWFPSLRGVARGLHRFFGSRAANHDGHRAMEPVNSTADPREMTVIARLKSVMSRTPQRLS